MVGARVGFALMAVVAVASGCNALWGIDELDYGRGSGGGAGDTTSTSSTTSNTAGTGGMAGAAGAGGSGGELLVPECGNGVIEAPEQCDDANDDPSDGCHDCDVQCDDIYEHEHPTTHHCYRIPPASNDWLGARDACIGWGGYLASLTTDEENSFVKALVTTNTWIGGHDRNDEATFEWVSGEPWSYVDWGPNQPDNDENEDCVEIREPELDWNDEGCGAGRDMVCERPPPEAGGPVPPMPGHRIDRP